MKKNRKLFTKIFTLFLLVSISVSIYARSVSYNIKDLYVISNVQTDGSMEVTEYIKYDIGYINGILFNLDVGDNTEIQNLHIYESESLTSDTANLENIKFREMKSNEYEVYLDDGLYKFKVYSQNEGNTKIFVFKYTLPNSVKVYNDVAEVNRKFVGRNWEQSIDNVRVVLNLPIKSDYDKSQVRAFAHGPLWGNLIFEKVNQIEFQLTDYSPRDFVEAHVIFPREIMTNVDYRYIINENAKDRILADEKVLAEEANAERDRVIKRIEQSKKYNNPKFIFLNLISKVLGAVSLGYFLNKLFKKGLIKNPNAPEYLRDIPEGLSPTEVGNLFNRGSFSYRGIYRDKKVNICVGLPSYEDTLPVILTLIKKRVLELSGEAYDVSLRLIKDNLDDLTEEEQKIIDIYINALGDGTEYNYQRSKSISGTKSDMAYDYIQEWISYVREKI